MNLLQRSGTLPTVLIPPGNLLEKRKLFRTRMILTQQRTGLKNRTNATLAKYALQVEESSDAFNKKGRKELGRRLSVLPPHTRYMTERVHDQLDSIQEQIGLFEERMKEVFIPHEELEFLKTLPGVGFILAEATFWLMKIGEDMALTKRTCVVRVEIIQPDVLPDSRKRKKWVDNSRTFRCDPPAVIGRKLKCFLEFFLTNNRSLVQWSSHIRKSFHYSE
jgi:hypothetical protein